MASFPSANYVMLHWLEITVRVALSESEITVIRTVCHGCTTSRMEHCKVPFVLLTKPHPRTTSQDRLPRNLVTLAFPQSFASRTHSSFPWLDFRCNRDKNGRLSRRSKGKEGQLRRPKVNKTCGRVRKSPLPVSFKDTVRSVLSQS